MNERQTQRQRYSDRQRGETHTADTRKYRLFREYEITNSLDESGTLLPAFTLAVGQTAPLEARGLFTRTKGKFILPGRDSDARIDNTDYK